MEFIKRTFFSSYRRAAGFFVVAALALSLPITITLLSQRQDLRQRAEGITMANTEAYTYSCQNSGISSGVIKTARFGTRTQTIIDCTNPEPQDTMTILFCFNEANGISCRPPTPTPTGGCTGTTPDTCPTPTPTPISCGGALRGTCVPPLDNCPVGYLPVGISTDCSSAGMRCCHPPGSAPISTPTPTPARVGGTTVSTPTRIPPPGEPTVLRAQAYCNGTTASVDVFWTTGSGSTQDQITYSYTTWAPSPAGTTLNLTKTTPSGAGFVNTLTGLEPGKTLLYNIKSCSTNGCSAYARQSTDGHYSVILPAACPAATTSAPAATATPATTTAAPTTGEACENVLPANLGSGAVAPTNGFCPLTHPVCVQYTAGGQVWDGCVARGSRLSTNACGIPAKNDACASGICQASGMRSRIMINGTSYVYTLPGTCTQPTTTAAATPTPEACSIYNGNFMGCLNAGGCKYCGPTCVSASSSCPVAPTRTSTPTPTTRLAATATPPIACDPVPSNGTINGADLALARDEVLGIVSANLASCMTSPSTDITTGADVLKIRNRIIGIPN